MLTMATLNEIMEFDCVVFVDADGNVTESQDKRLYAPNLVDYLPDGDKCLQEQARAAGWDGLLTGFTGQFGYNGPLMHESECIGDGLARYILGNPGWYCATAITDGDSEDGDLCGWAIAYKRDRFSNTLRREMRTWLYRVVANFGPSTTHNTLESALRAWNAQTFNTRVNSGVVRYLEWDENGDCVRDCAVIHVLSSGSIYVLPTIGGLP